MAYITLNKNNFFYNLDIIASKTKSKDKIALVLKDNAYGHGLCEVAQMAKEYGISKAVVRSNDEAQEVKEFFKYVLVLADIPTKPSQNVHYTINELQAIKKFPKATKVHLKVNSGMNRNGIELEELAEAFKLIKECELELKAVFTHHSSADEDNEYFAFQFNNFEKIKQEARKLAQIEGWELKFHSSNSAALFRQENFDEDMARVGIAAYGCLDMPKSLCDVSLKPVLSVYARRNSTRKLSQGDCVGYNATFRSDKEQLVSNYDFGYGDGFFRACSKVYVTPQNVQLTGIISMDNSSFLSDQEELLIFDDARDVAKYVGTISYEVLTSLKSYIEKKVV